MQVGHAQALLVLQNGRVRLERYGSHAAPQTLWTGFSMTKSVTSTLVGAALQDRSIRSMDDNVARYLPGLTGSAYDGVTIRQLLTMTSGARWVEDYTAPDSDNVRLYGMLPEHGRESVVTYMSRLPRQSAPGSHWLYNTGETDLTGALLRAATGKSLSRYLAETIWQPAGMEADATWIAEDGHEYGGSGLSATLRDWGRFGLLAMEKRDGKGAGAVDPAWFAQATRTQQSIGEAGRGYGYQWWTFDDGSFAALGIFGQSMLVDPKRNLVIVVLGAAPTAVGPEITQRREALWSAVRSTLDAEDPNRQIRPSSK